MNVSKEELIQKMAEKYIDVEFSGRHTWTSCMETARTRAIMCAKALLNIVLVEIKDCHEISL